MSRIARRIAGIGASDLPNAAAFDAYVGPAREITVDPERGIIALHDGVTEGGQKFRTQPEGIDATPVETFGAIGDGDGIGGGTDNSEAIAQALTYAVLTGVPVQFQRGKIYRCDTALTHTGSGKIAFIGGGSIDFNNCTSITGFIVIAGPAMSNTQPITATVQGPTNTIPVADASGFVPGDIIWLYSNENYSTDVGSARTEFAIIDKISGNTLTTMNPVVSTYTFTGTNTNNRSVRKFHPTCNPTLDIAIIGKFGGLTQPQDVADADQKGIILQRTAYARFKIDAFHVADRSFAIQDSIFAIGEGVRAFNSDQEGLGYAFVDGGNQWCNFGDIIGHNCRHVTSSGFSTSGGVARENIFGNISGFGCRDAVIDTHDGVCDIKYGNILGSFKMGNSSTDAGVTMQGSRITTGDITLINFTGHGILIQFEGGDPGRDHFYKFGLVNATCRVGATGTVVVVANTSGALAQDIDLVFVTGLIGKSATGVLAIPTNASIKKVHIGAGKVTALSGTAVEARSTALGYSKINCFGLEIETLSATNGNYAVYASGTTYTAANAGKFGAEIELYGCLTKGGNQVHMRAYDGRIEIHGGRQEFSPTHAAPAKYIKSGIGVIKTPTLVDAT